MRAAPNGPGIGTCESIRRAILGAAAKRRALDISRYPELCRLAVVNCCMVSVFSVFVFQEFPRSRARKGD